MLGLAVSTVQAREQFYQDFRGAGTPRPAVRVSARRLGEVVSRKASGL